MTKPRRGKATRREAVLHPVPMPGEDTTVSSALRLAAMREHSLLALSELSQNLSAAPDLFHLADLVLFNLMGQFGTSKSALWVRSENEGAPPVLLRAHGVNRSIARAIGVACMARLDAASDDEASGLGPAWDDDVRMMSDGLGLALIARIPGRDRALGLLALGTRINGQPYGEVDGQSLQAALSVVGVAIQSLALFNRLAENNRQLRRANQELQELDQLKFEFLSNVNHELRTPLTIMLGYLESIVDNRLPQEQERRIMTIVLDEARKLGSMLVNLATFSDASEGRLTLQMELDDLGAATRRYCEERKPGANLGLREFSWTIEDYLPKVRFDDKRMEQVIDALVDNALKFTSEGAQIEVHVRRVERHGASWVAIDIVDDGPGILPGRIPTLFDSFRQVDGSSTRTIGGMGIGLAFSRQLVMAMGGELDVQSIPGNGTIFTVLMPSDE
jgi:signal transduction histidine kinase